MQRVKRYGITFLMVLVLYDVWVICTRGVDDMYTIQLELLIIGWNEYLSSNCYLYQNIDIECL